MPTLTPVEGDPFAQKPGLTPVEGNPFAASAPSKSAKLTPVAGNPFAAPKPQPRSQPQPKAAPSVWDQIGSKVAGVENAVGRTFENIPSSAAATAKGLVQPVLHPIDTAKALGHDVMHPIETAGRIKDYATSRYGSLSKAGQTIQKDPVGALLDASIVAAPLEGAVRGGAEAAGRAAVGARLGGVRGAAKMAFDRSPITGKSKGFGATALPAGVDLAKANQAADKPMLPDKGPALGTRAYRSVVGAVSPTRASPEARATGLLIRKARGGNQLDADRAAWRLDQIDKRFQRATPEQERSFYRFMEGRSSAPESDKPGVMAKGEPVRGGEYDFARDLGMNTRDIADANAFRQVFREYRDKAERLIRKNVGAAPKFITDYFPHMWKNDPAEVEQKMAAWVAGKQGSGRNFRQRSIPTIEDGIAAGLTPRYGPVQTAQIYAQNMSRFLTTHEVQGWMKENGHGGWFRPGEQPEGWVPLDGILTERQPRMTGGGRRGGGPNAKVPGGSVPKGPMMLTGPGGEQRLIGSEPPTIDQKALPGGMEVLPVGPEAQQGSLGAESRLGIEDAASKARDVTPPEGAAAKPREVGDRRVNKEQLYAPREVARIYNNYISKPFDPTAGPAQAVAHGAYKLAVNDMLWKFALSAYHASTMSLESVVSSVASGAQAFSRGDFTTALKDIVTAPLRPVLNVKAGADMRSRMLGDKVATPFEKRLDDAFTKAGGSLKMDRDYRGTAAKSFYSALKGGTLKREAMRSLEAIAGKDKSVLERGKAGLELGANILTSISGPLFEDIIPRLKMGAFSQTMEAYLKRFPDATEREVEEFAARTLDTMDNRFGEMIRDNMFWRQTTQQVLQSVMLAPTWLLGSAREMIGGVHDIPESIRGIKGGKGITSRTAYLMAMPAVVATINGVMTYLKTGKAPQGMDFAAYRTGGTDARSGEPERALIPGNQKEAYEWINAVQPESGGLSRYLYGKANDISGTAADLMSNSDYKGDEIYGPGAMPGAAGQYAADRALPIAVSTGMNGQMKGSKISNTEQLLGTRPAPFYISSPKKMEEIRRKRIEKAQAMAKARARKQQQRYGQ